MTDIEMFWAFLNAVCIMTAWLAVTVGIPLFFLWWHNPRWEWQGGSTSSDISSPTDLDCGD